MSTAKEVLRQSHRAATLEQLHSTAAPHTASWSRNRRPDQPYCDLPDTTPAARESNACGTAAGALPRLAAAPSQRPQPTLDELGDRGKLVFPDFTFYMAP